ncbi:hypothetical protein NC653_022096 [Populus alba x Populus x berolinensis]|uniref:Uncharacterized protein n=1 Tax=Populus alba x Populus x berolinensis TaxID=444605 RepID=A0AAD6QFH9_9ROSI|nr:hypothetical protein NC653_022096 [Populus alba x Populus x berolinensis]
MMSFAFCGFYRIARSTNNQIGSRLSWSRNHASKDIRIGVDACDGIKVTVDTILGIKCQKTVRFSLSHNLKK